MMVYADSSFLVRLVTSEPGSEAVVAQYRRMGRPRLAFAPLHDLEVRNSLRLKAFLERQSDPISKRSRLGGLPLAWERRLDFFLERGMFKPCAYDWSAAFEEALRLSAKHTAILGTRAFDILHVSLAAELKSADFVTCDRRQAKLAKAAGLKAALVETV
jgi:predicted nucleic acid-binding protein